MTADVAAYPTVRKSDGSAASDPTPMPTVPPFRVRCGVDVVNLTRFKAVWMRQGQALIDRLMTADEQAALSDRSGDRWVASVAARFAAKEAVAKALGTGIWGRTGVGFHDMAVCGGGDQPLSVQLSGRAAATYRRLGGFDLSISVSHDGDAALAQCVMLCIQTQQVEQDEEE